MKSGLRKNIMRGALGLFAVTILFVGFVGYLHTPSGRKLPIARTLLTALGYSCPADAMTGQDMDMVRKYVAKNSAELKVATSKEALSFYIGESNEKEVREWLVKNKVECISGVRGYNFLKCQNVESFPESWKTKGPVTEIDFSFSTSGKLVAIDILRRRLNAKEGYLTAKNILSDLTTKLGKPNIQTGDLNDNSFKNNFATFVVEYNFKDYTARISTSVLPSSGVVMYEQYLSMEAEPDKL